MNLLRKFKYAIFLSSYFTTLVLTKKICVFKTAYQVPSYYKFFLSFG